VHIIGSYYTNISRCTVNKTLKMESKILVVNLAVPCRSHYSLALFVGGVQEDRRNFFLFTE